MCTLKLPDSAVAIKSTRGRASRVWGLGLILVERMLRTARAPWQCHERMLRTAQAAMNGLFYNIGFGARA